MYFNGKQLSFYREKYIILYSDKVQNNEHIYETSSYHRVSSEKQDKIMLGFDKLNKC
jgi:hypothetical protein